MHRVRTEITNLKAQAQVSAKTIADLSAQNEELAKSKADFKERYEAAKVHRECAEKNQEELRQQLVSKDRDMAGKDAEILELQCRLRELQEKVDSLEIDLEAEKQKAESVVEARKVSQAALDVA
ncbi:hypothetical protein HanPI659440_Chr05g0203661 [Helianthus annuus]|nr:hypothetical protein HanPI659440_Chr05g0203661 [Helianthus annuus]